MGGEFTYKYDDGHNLTRIEYPDGTYKALTYNKDKDLVSSFRDQKGCVENYTYKTDPSDRADHFTSFVQKSCNNKVTNISTYEFIYGRRNDGLGTNLNAVITTINGARSRIDYDLFGRIKSVEKGGSTKRYFYDPAGRIVQREKGSTVEALTYNANCRRPTLVLVSSSESSLWSVAQYNVSCLVTFVSANDRAISMVYDDSQRIEKITDNRGNSVEISYGRNGKPNLVKLQGVGSITVRYNDINEIEEVLSEEGSDASIKIASVFNDLLDLISPFATAPENEGK
jgi:hypothetical protein